MTDLEQLLKGYRRLEKREDLAGVVDDPTGIRFLAAWRRQVPTWKRSRAKQPTEIGLLWVWVWAGVRYDREALAIAAKVNESTAELYLRSCVSARIVYPDGSISKPAERLIAAHVKNRFPGTRRGRPPGVKDSSKRTRTPATKDEGAE
ncbi:hypothetical protein LCGC14_0678550 [marine sediment metagenome]|uniref:Uncharacterized protein n=2 Tax=root TaxID=1 RepID=A0A9C9TIQ0_9HYPH|nr:hypothetical protein [Aurantimonas coralicida]